MSALRDAVRAEIDRELEADLGPLPDDATEGERAARAVTQALARLVCGPHMRPRLCSACGARIGTPAANLDALTPSVATERTA